MSRKHCSAGFSLIEVIFAIAMLGIGVIAILSLFTTGIQSSNSAQNTTTAAVETQSLAARITSETDSSTPPKRIFLERIAAGKEWIHSEDGSERPVPVARDSEYSWKCRARSVPMDPNDLSKDQAGGQALPQGLYQIAIFVYRNYKDGKEPISVYTTMVTAGY